ncbi:MAG TPA: hypothetical protein VFW50_29155 [Streptosporangiaceae bacterium]|nr:hypothetical protein [Streptosporangiaceae bacterium]
MDAAMLDAFGLDPDVLHLNHGAFGVAPVVVRQAAAAWRDRAERNPHRFNRVEVSGLVAAARERAAGFLGADPARTAWVRNVSEGVSAVLGSLELHPGDELVISTHGYGAVRPGADVTPGVLSWQQDDGYAASFDYPGTWDYAGWLAAEDGLAYWAALGGCHAVARLSGLAASGRWPARWGLPRAASGRARARDAAGTAAQRRPHLP